jgi:ABC-type glycerol-3-phosphate transport system substrate-binding protein
MFGFQFPPFCSIGIITKMKTITRTLTMLLLVSLLVGACDILIPEQTETPQTTATETPQPERSPTESAAVQSETVLIWVAPPFDPETVGGGLLMSRLSAYETQNPNVRISLRVKPQSGPGGLLAALDAASVAAPAVVPDLLTLAPDDLQTAAEAALIVPLPDALVQPDDPGWYDYALSQSRIGGISYGIPFASDLEILAYRTDQYPVPPRSWEAILEEPRTLLFPAADPRARFILAMYLGNGGTLTDESGNPKLDSVVLEQVLTLLVSARSSSVIPLAVRQYASPLETWTELKANRSASAMAPLPDFLHEGDPERLAATALPTENSQGISLASNWSWGVTTSDSARQELIFELLTWLSDPAFEGSFTYALGMLPTSQQALANWPESEDSALASSLVTITRAEPNQALRNVIAPALLAAIEAVLGAGQDPAQAAQEAADLVNSP